MIACNRTITRETGERDRRTRRPIVLQLVEGGHLVRVKLKGQRTWYTVTMGQILHQGQVNRAFEIRAERKARPSARRQGIVG